MIGNIKISGGVGGVIGLIIKGMNSNIIVMIIIVKIEFGLILLYLFVIFVFFFKLDLICCKYCVNFLLFIE